jgi:hypothetical protein
MTHSFKLSRRIARLRAPVVATIILTLAACSNTDSLAPDSGAPSRGGDLGSPAGVTMAPKGARALAGASPTSGIPFGTFAQPISEFGTRFSGAKRTVGPELMLEDLAAIKERGGRVVLMLAGNDKYYKDGAGHFDYNKWKARIDRFKGINFSSYVDDGTIIGHYLIDEPNDPVNWNGRPIPGSMVEQMAQYSKQLWPDLTTIVRVTPTYLTGNYRYLDAAWAQYLARRGDVGDYLRRNIADAQSRGLALIVGLNLLKGGPNGTPMTASQVESYGSALLSSTYPCAFISWQYSANYLASGSVASALDALRNQADNRANKSCQHP